MSNLNAITKVAKGYAAAMPDIEQVTVAALDESISGTGQPFKNLYMVIVCSPPGTKGREKLPGLVQDLETLGDYGLLIWRNTSDLSRGEASGLSRGEALAKAWIRGLTDLVKQAQNELMVMRYPPIGLLYVDGPMRPELYPLMGMGTTLNSKGELVKGELEGIKVVAALKNRSHRYNPGLDPFGEGLLTLADMAAGFFRKEGDRPKSLESMV